VWFEAKYPLADEVGPDIYDGIVEIKPGGKAPELPKRKVSMHARILDRTCRYLIIGETGGEVDQYRIIDLMDGAKEICRHPCSHKWLTEFVHSSQATDSSGTTVVANNYYAHGGRIPFWEENKSLIAKKELWKWNVLSNKAERVSVYTPHTQLKISRDGSTLLEIQHASTLSPSLLLPLSLSSIVGAQVEDKYGLNDLAIMRIWSLPAMTLRCTISLPWLYRYDSAELSPDGAFVVLADVEIYGDSLSLTMWPHYYQQPSYGGHLPRSYTLSPRELCLYDAETGQLAWRKTDYEGSFSYEPNKRPMLDMITFERLPFSDHVVVHLPSKKQITSALGYSSAQLDNKRLQSVHHLNQYVTHDEYAIYTTESNGTSARTATLKLKGHHPFGNDPCLITHDPQYLIEKLHTYEQFLPTWLTSYLSKINGIKTWLGDIHQEVSVIDYEHSRKLWSLKGEQRAPLNYQVTEQWLVITKSDKEHFYLSVYALPFPSWSPWWSIAAGLIVLILSCYWLHRKAEGIPTP